MIDRFHTTCWTMVLDAARDGGQESRPALEELCRRYWLPLHTYVVGSGHSSTDADDLTQAFFEHLLEQNLAGHANPERGRFRTFLLTAFRNFIVSEECYANTRKRGGDWEHLSIQDERNDLSNELRDNETPELAYERKWAHTLLQIAMDQLADEQVQSGSGERFAALQPLLLHPDGARTSFGDLGQSLQMSDGALRTALSRLRTRFRELVRAEVARLLDDPAEVDDELAHLLRVLRT